MKHTVDKTNHKAENCLYNSHYDILMKGIKLDLISFMYPFLLLFISLLFHFLLDLHFSPVYVCVVNVGLQL